MMKKLFVFLSLIFVGASYADTETVTWYKDGSVYDTTTCQTGDDITVPNTTPTKRGYTFNGWVFVYDFSTFDPRVAASSYERAGSNWYAVFPYGTISGVWLCSASPGTNAVVGTPDESGTGDRKYCWCRATKYIPSGTNITYENMLSSPPWVNTTGVANQSDCLNGYCVTLCGTRTASHQSFRRSLFGISQ